MRTVEHVWMYKDLVCVIMCVHGFGGYLTAHRCAYIIIPESHPLFDVPYDRINEEFVHGGFTYSGREHITEVDEQISYPHRWLGWDYGHYGDTPELFPYERVAVETQEVAKYLHGMKSKTVNVDLNYLLRGDPDEEY